MTEIQLGKEPGVPYGYIAQETVNPKWLIVSLHGQGEIGNGKSDLKKVATIGVLEWASKVNLAGRVVVAPQCATKDGFYGKTLNDYIGKMCTKYKVSRENVALLGISQGAISIYKYLLSYSVHAAVCIAGQGSPSKAGLTINTKLWAFHGGYDRKVETHESIDFVNAYNAAKPPVTAKLDIFPFEGHSNYVWDRVCQTQEVYDWMTN